MITTLDQAVQNYEKSNPGFKVAIGVDYSKDIFLLLVTKTGKIEFSSPWFAMRKSDGKIRHFNPNMSDNNFFEALEKRAKHYIEMDENEPLR